MNGPGRDKEQFLKRINKAAREDEDGKLEKSEASKYWLLGSTNRSRGSISSDLWVGTAADAAGSGLIGVYPVIGWWRERKNLERVSKQARYTLIVSIHTPLENVDLYTPVMNQLAIET